jgi:hypothetical protein
MTVQKSFKRLVRVRMANTGKSYTAARAQLLAGVGERSTDAGAPQLACSDERIRERTGRGWEEWFVELSERTVSKPKSARFDLGDGTSRLLATVEAKGPAKSTVVVEHSRLADADEREARKVYWRHALATLKAELERDASAISGSSR